MYITIDSFVLSYKNGTFQELPTYNNFLETIGKEKTKNYKLLIRKLDECPEYYGNVINVLQIDEILKNREYVKMMNMIEESDYYDRETIIKYLLYKEKNGSVSVREYRK